MSGAPPLLAILVVTSSDLTSPNKHLLFHYPPQPSLQSPFDGDAEDDSSDDSASIASAETASSTTSSRASLPSSKYSRATGERSYTTIEDDEDQHDDAFAREEDDESPYRRSGRVTEWEQPIFGLSKKDLAQMLVPKDLGLFNRKFELGLEDVVFLGHPVHLTPAPAADATVLATSPSSSINDDAESDVIIQKVKLTKFHIVFVLNPSWRLDYQEQVQNMYNQILKKFVDACTIEQKERGYISLEAYNIHKFIRDAEDNGSSLGMSAYNRTANVHCMGRTCQDFKPGILDRDSVPINRQQKSSIHRLK
jgi:Nitrogen Permease regulator of amino acid transport activity 3